MSDERKKFPQDFLPEVGSAFIWLMLFPVWLLTKAVGLAAEAVKKKDVPAPSAPPSSAEGSAVPPTPQTPTGLEGSLCSSDGKPSTTVVNKEATSMGSDGAWRRP